MTEAIVKSITLDHYVVLSAIVFVIGVCGLFWNKSNIINILMSIEIMLLGVNINFVAFSVFLQDISGQIFAIFVLTIAAAEATIGLAILILYFRNKGEIFVSNLNKMKG